MKQSFVFSGSGGQGIMSAGITLATTAIDMGKHSTYLPEYGPEQRGGSAKCTVIISDGDIVSPLPKQTDNLIVLNGVAYRKFIDDLKPGGVLIANTSLITDPIERDDVIVIAVPVDEIAAQIGNVKVANIILLGILAGATGIVERKYLIEGLEAKFGKKKPEVLEMNIKAVDKGIEIGKQHAI